MDLANGLDLSGYPPPPVLWVTAMIDTVCYPLQCAQWRQTLGIHDDDDNSSWLAYKVPSLMDTLPSFTSFQDFVQQQETTEKVDVWQSLFTYAFKTPSTALGDLTTPSAAVVLVCLVLLLRSIKSTLQPFFSNLGRSIGRRTHGLEWEAANEERIAKFGEYVFRLIYHSSISIYGVYYFWDKEWWAASSKDGRSSGTMSLYQGFPYHPVEPGMAWYYLLQAAYNLDAMLSLLELSFTVRLQSPVGKALSGCKSRWRSPISIGWSETVRGDFQEMMIHHVVTNLLVIGSSLCRLTRIGSMVFMVHDLSDIPVDLSKLANFLKWKWTTLSCFLSMVLVWMVTRLYILPFTIYRSILTQSHYVLQEGLPVILYVNYRHIFYVLVGLLILLHVAWFVMFLQMFATFVKKSECHDLSEHKKGEVQEGSSEEQRPTSTKLHPQSPKSHHPSQASAEISVVITKRIPENNFSEEKKDN